MMDCKPAWTPLPHNAKLSTEDPNNNTTLHKIEIEGKTVLYPSVVSSLMYAMLATHPDIAFPVGVLGHYSANPKECHWEFAKQCLHYLKATEDMELKFDGADVSLDMDFHSFIDADMSGDPDTSKSTSGFVLISNWGAIRWASKCQAMVAQSSTESEYIGLCHAGQHLAWLRTFFKDIRHWQKKPMDLYNDNQAVIILSRDSQFQAHTKHIQRKHHFLCNNLIAKKEAVVSYIPMDDMVADLMTKAPPMKSIGSLLKPWDFDLAQVGVSGSSGQAQSPPMGQIIGLHMFGH
jgi:hypothetical protein